ncbi:hypothetical protein D3C87_879650 [compost metagenome]
MDTISIIIIVIVVISVILLLMLEYKYQDCINGKPCKSGFINVDTSDSTIDQLLEMVTISESYVTWRLSLIVALLLTIPITYLILYRMPNLQEFLITALIIFTGCYFSSSWLWSHWVQPNNAKIKSMLLQLRKEL